MALIAMLSALALQGETQATPATPQSIVVPSREWRSLPSGNDLLRAYPKPAFRDYRPGAALIGCRVAADQRLEACEVLQELPAGEGFGAAALLLMPKFRMKAETPDGRSVVGGRVEVPISFRRN